MFNRLPIYTRPREPTIGNPVLIDTTNVRLAGHPGLQIVGLDGKPLTNMEIGDKGLPQLPPLQLDLDDDFRPPPPLRLNTLYPTTKSPATHRKGTDEPSRKNNAQRKPAPLVVVPLNNSPPSRPRISEDRASSTSSDGSSSSTMTDTSLPKSSSSGPASHGGSSKSKGFTLGSAVKDKVTGRRKGSESSANSKENKNNFLKPESPPPQAAKPPNFISIDDWLSNREGMHKRSTTITSVSTQASRWKDPVRLHIRQSTFAPLRAPAEFTSLEPTPELPPIPVEFLAPLSPPISSKASQRSPPTSAPKIHIERPPTPPITPLEQSLATSSSPEQPRDHIQQLDYESEKLNAQKWALKREINELKLLLPPNPSTYNLSARERMQEKVQELEIKLADIEKEIHEVGMRLHRAWRRRDREMGGEGPTHLWVSRVSGRDE
ncbi:hypothetical protein RUND412_004577 [Rhizina undulata]